MKAKIEQLQKLRETLEVIKGEIDDSKAVWELANRSLLNDKEETEAKLRELDCEIRNERVSIYDGIDKSKIFGVGVQEQTQLDYDQKKAYDWAVKHNMFLILAKSPFERYAKGGKLDFVIVKKVVQATIARDLTKYLEDTNGL